MDLRCCVLFLAKCWCLPMIFYSRGFSGAARARGPITLTKKSYVKRPRALASLRCSNICCRGLSSGLSKVFLRVFFFSDNLMEPFMINSHTLTFVLLVCVMLHGLSMLSSVPSWWFSPHTLAIFDHVFPAITRSAPNWELVVVH